MTSRFRKQMLALALPATMILHALGQGTFQNLDFESPIFPLDRSDPNGVPITNALPGWTGYFNGGQTSRAWYDDVSLGGPGISLQDAAGGFFQPIQGTYSVFLQGSGAGPAYSAAIGQTGQIPASAASLRFWADPRSNLQVTFGGQVIPIVTLGSTPSYNIFGGDVFLFAGQTAELRFTGPANSGGYFDNIFFSDQAIPEPGAFGLLGLGAALVGWRFGCRRT